MTCATLSQLLCVPTVRTEKSGSVSVWHNDSADAIFIGCWTNISLPWMSPVKNSPTAATSATRQPAIVAGRYIVVASAASSGRLCERTISHADTAATNVAAVSSDPATTWRNAQIAVLFVSNAPKSTSSARFVTGLNRDPTGCCMNELAAMMKKPGALTPNATIQRQARWTSRGSRLQPKIHSPRNVDSKKNAIKPSNANGAPKMSPTKREYSLQFMPN